MSESFDSIVGTDPSFGFGGSNVDFWRNMLSENSQEIWCSRLDEDWGHVLKDNKKVTRKMKGSRSSTMNSGSDISEALSFISSELSLSSSSSSSTPRSYGEADEDAQKDHDALNLQEKMDVSIEQLSGANHLEYPPVCVGGDIPSSESIEGDTLDASGEVNNDNFQVPKLGMTFFSEEEVYEFYKDYAMGIGFKVRKAKVQKLADGSISKRYFFCSRQGLKQQSKKLRKYERKVTRTGCQAKIQCAVKNGKWVISQVFVQHNHHLECQKQVKRPYTKTSEVQLTIHPESETNLECQKQVERPYTKTSEVQLTIHPESETNLECQKQVKRPYTKTSDVQLTIHPENETKKIASTSGRYWGSVLLKVSSSEEDQQRRKFKRMGMLSNDESAPRNRMRKPNDIDDLVAQIRNVEAKNIILGAQISELSQRMDLLKERIFSEPMQ